VLSREEGTSLLPAGDALSNTAQEAVGIHHKTPKPYSTKLFSSQSAPSLYWCMRLFFLGCKTLHLQLLDFTRLIPQLIIAIKKPINPVL